MFFQTASRASQRPSNKLRLIPALLSVLALGSAIPAMAAEEPPADLEDEYQNGSHLVDGAAFLHEGSLDVRITGPEYLDEFTSEAKPVDAFPGTLLMEDTPYGDVFVYDTGHPTEPNYILGFADLGIATPLTAVGELFVGTYGGFSFEVSATPVAQGPQGPQGPSVSGGTRVNGIPGWNLIRITEPCPGARFRQFFTKTVTWKGQTLGPLPPIPVGGTAGGTTTGTGNNGQPVDISGGTAYVDSNNSLTGANTPPGFDATNNGDYPAQTNGGSTSIKDAPNVLDPTKMVNDIENANPGVRVTEITQTWRFTTYVIKAGVISSKIQWTAVETITIPTAVPNLPGPSFGGPGPGGNPAPFDAGGRPTVTPTNMMDPQHAAAHAGYMGGNFGGAPSQGGY